MLEILADEPDFEWLMIDASHCKVHPHAVGAVFNLLINKNSGLDCSKPLLLLMRMTTL